MPPLCRQRKRKASLEKKSQLLTVLPAAIPMARSSSALGGRARLWETVGVDEANQTDEEVAVDGGWGSVGDRGRRPS